MSWYDTIFGYWGLPLTIVIITGLIMGMKIGLICYSIWATMYLYSYVKFGEERGEA